MIFSLNMNANDPLTMNTVLSIYVFFTAFRLLAYVPQFLLLAREKSEAKVISLLTYWMWVGGNFSTGVYASLVSNDFWLCLGAYLNGLCCLVVSLMVHYKRMKYAPAKNELVTNKVPNQEMNSAA